MILKEQVKALIRLGAKPEVLVGVHQLRGWMFVLHFLVFS